MKRNHIANALVLAAGLFALVATPAWAQDGGQPSPDDIKKKVKEIDRLMKEAEQALVKSTDQRSAEQKAKDAQAELEKILDQKCQEQTGKSAQDLRKEAEEGSAEASKAIEKLMQEATNELTKKVGKGIGELLEGGGESSEGAAVKIRRLLEETRNQSGECTSGIQWLLDNATSSNKQPQKPPQKKEPPQPQDKKPEHDLEDPKDPDRDKWLADLPKQVRQAYETQDWDAIPPKWRHILKEWTKKMAKELEKDR